MEFSPAGEEHTHTVILLHGRDSTAQEFGPEFFESRASDDRNISCIFPTIKWVFPTANMIISSRFGLEISQWFDMHSTEDPHEREAEQDLSASIVQIQHVVAREAAMIGAENVIMGGISQGCALAIHALLAGGLRLGGFIGFCSWVARPSALRLYDNTAALKTPLLLSHVQDDGVISIRLGEELRDTLSSLGMNVRWASYPTGGHWLNEPQGVDDIAFFLREIGVKAAD